ncbi:hypothetical protein ACFSKI_21385 [Pseudogracilibacillus auburnensis]|uniref:Uncharacterized protein n=1 Tax=Pseudogracilibacillus auburnensis TaxID=1494959 RepID=A0A2V3VIG8_9BACI|nr:hypothetical protein [Pseudogracilibacillus auburnensis]PXW81632.1 hypothetical protein DFR56_1205 [Pseudogracilibacillus auburnensis]
MFEDDKIISDQEIVAGYKMANNIIIERTSIQWKSPVLGTPTRRAPEHYFGRTIHALVHGEDKIYRLKPDEIPLEATEED